MVRAAAVRVSPKSDCLRITCVHCSPDMCTHCLFPLSSGDLVSRNDVVKDLELKPDDKIFAIESSGDDKRDEAEIAWMSVSSHGKSMGAPLIAACADGNVRRVRKLLRQGENVQEQYFEGGSEEAGTRRRPSPPSHAGTGSKTLGTEEVPMTPLRAAKAFGGAKPELLKILIDAGATE